MLLKILNYYLNLVPRNTHVMHYLPFQMPKLSFIGKREVQNAIDQK